MGRNARKPLVCAGTLENCACARQGRERGSRHPWEAAYVRASPAPPERVGGARPLPSRSIAGGSVFINSVNSVTGGVSTEVETRGRGEHFFVAAEEGEGGEGGACLSGGREPTNHHGARSRRQGFKTRLRRPSRLLQWHRRDVEETLRQSCRPPSALRLAAHLF